MGGELYRCVAANGAVAFQDAPCGDGSQLSRTIPVLVDPVRTEPQTRTARKPTSATPKPGTGAAKSGGTDSRSRQRAACAQARKRRDATLERLGLNRTFETLRALDDAVYDACKGF